MVWDDCVGRCVARPLTDSAPHATQSRLTLALTTSPSICAAVLCAPLPLAEAFAVPSLSAAVGIQAQRSARHAAPRTVDTATSTAAAAAGAADDEPQQEEAAVIRRAYGTFYTMMNIGLLCCGPLVDGLRSYLSHPYRYTCLVSAACGGLTLLLARHLDHVMMADHTEEEQPEPVCSGPAPDAACLSPPAKPQSWGGQEADQEQVATRRWRRRRGFLMLVLLLVGVRALFRHLDATFPKYFLRMHGDDAPFGLGE